MISLDVNVNVKYNSIMNLNFSTSFLRSGLRSPRNAPTPAHLDEGAAWGIAETANYFEITPRTLRFYEDKGLLTSSRKGGGRQFSPTQRLRLEDILRAKRAGFSLGDIREVMDVIDGHVSDYDELLRRKENFSRVIKSLMRRRKDIDILAGHLKQLCIAIDNFEASHANNPDSAQDGDTFRYAKDYHAALQQSLTPNS